MPTALKTYWNYNRGDNFATATLEGEKDAQIAGYTLVREEAFIFTESERPAGTVALRLFWSPMREDNFTTATAQGAQDAQAAGYQEIRTEGYIYPDEKPNTVPLRLFWNPMREDNFTTATAQGAHDAQTAGYQEIRIEGFVLPNPSGERVVRAQAERDFGGGKHGAATATLDGSGRLTVLSNVWTNSPFQGFTMGIKVLLLTANGQLIAETVGGPGPYGVNGRLVPGGPPEQIGVVFTQDFDPAQAARTAEIKLFLFWAPKWRILNIINGVFATVDDVAAWIAEFCKKYPEVCTWVVQ